jgi:hypothetical protein
MPGLITWSTQQLRARRSGVSGKLSFPDIHSIVSELFDATKAERHDGPG